MSRAQIYATTRQVIDDLSLPGDEPGLLERIREASAHVCALMGDFVPVTEERTFEASDSGKTRIDPLISLTTIEDGDGNSIGTDDYDLLPHNRLWANGPYRYVDGPGGEMTITGRWGLWELWQASGLSGTLAAASTTSLTVTNGAVLWPGAILRMGTEQLLVSAGCGGENSPDPTLATSVLTSDLASDDDVIYVTNGAEFNAGEVLRIDVEDMLIKRKAGNIAVVVRGWNNTHRMTHEVNAAIYVYRSVTIERGVNGTTAVAQAGVAIELFRLPEDVNYLVRQIAALMRMKAMTGFSGRAGNADAGESFYISEFPSRVIDAVRWNYKY